VFFVETGFSAMLQGKTGLRLTAMKVAVFSTKKYDRQFLEAANVAHNHELVFLEPHLNELTVSLAAGFPAVCLFVNDQANAKTLAALASNGTRLIALRAAGFNNVDLQAAAAVGIKVVRVPAYSPYAIAEHAVGLILMLNRKLLPALCTALAVRYWAMMRIPILNLRRSARLITLI
jgi:D-lactate dehydrogenase